MVRHAEGGQMDGWVCRGRSGRWLGKQNEVRRMVGYAEGGPADG